MMTKAALSKLALLALFTCIVCNPTQAEELDRNRGWLGEVSLDGRVVEVNQEHRFVLINLGSADGVKKGMVFYIFQRDEEVAQIKAAKVRRNITACDIQLVYTGKGIGVGDIAIYKETPPLVKMFKPIEPKGTVEVQPIVVDIDAPKGAIFKKALTVLEEFGAIVTDADYQDYILQAYKNIDNPLMIDILTEWGPNIQNKIFYTVEVTTTPRYNRLVINLRGVYDKEGTKYAHEIEKTSSIYKEAQEIGFTIKDLAERL